MSLTMNRDPAIFTFPSVSVAAAAEAAAAEAAAHRPPPPPPPPSWGQRHIGTQRNANPTDTRRHIPYWTHMFGVQGKKEEKRWLHY